MGGGRRRRRRKGLPPKIRKEPGSRALLVMSPRGTLLLLMNRIFRIGHTCSNDGNSVRWLPPRSSRVSKRHIPVSWGRDRRPVFWKLAFINPSHIPTTADSAAVDEVSPEGFFSTCDMSCTEILRFRL